MKEKCSEPLRFFENYDIIIFTNMNERGNKK